MDTGPVHDELLNCVQCLVRPCDLRGRLKEGPRVSVVVRVGSGVPETPGQGYCAVGAEKLTVEVEISLL